ncbi:HAD family hydrolase [Bacillus sp. BGMRC 2118]|nr:HAD family hydrolase [Bacillus sp. BGMRC 2118]
MKWEVIYFDIDNTLFDYEESFQKGMMATCKKSIKNINEGEWFKHFKMFCDEFWGKYERKEWTQQEYRYQRLYHSLLPFNIQISQPFSEMFHNEFERTVHNYATPYPDVIPTLYAFKERGHKLGIISNGKTQTQMNKLIHLGVFPFFEGNIFISADIKYEKPDPRIFHYVRQRLGEVNLPLYIGDSYEQDVAGAKEADWDVIHFQYCNSKSLRENIPVCSSYQEILEYITMN